MKNKLAPIVVFTYKRLDTLTQSVNALKECKLAIKSDIYFYSDFYKNDADKDLVLEVRNYLKGVSGFNSIKIIYSEFNKGLANSVISGVSEVISKHGKVIVLEDDLIPAKNFLVYMNKSLFYYSNKRKVFSISGYTIPIEVKYQNNYDIYYLPRASSWGWGTWIDRWENIDWEVSNFDDFFKSKSNISKFNEGGSDMYSMLKKQINGNIDSWAIRWCYAQHIDNTLTVYPLVSKIRNIGCGKSATHSNVYNRYKTKLDDSSNFEIRFNNNISIDNIFLRQFQLFFSLRKRFIGRVKTHLFKLKVLDNISE